MKKYLRLFLFEASAYWFVPLIFIFPLIQTLTYKQSGLLDTDPVLSVFLCIILYRIFDTTPFQAKSSNGNNATVSTSLEFYFSVAIKRTAVFWTKAAAYLVICSFPAIISLGFALAQPNRNALPIDPVPIAWTMLILTLSLVALFQVVLSVFSESGWAKALASIFFVVLFVTGTLGFMLITQSESPFQHFLALSRHHPIVIFGTSAVAIAAMEVFCCRRFVRQEIL